MGRTWRETYSQMIKNATAKRTLISASFELTSRCNLQCKMCYVCQAPGDQEIKKKELTASQWIQLAKEARDEGLLFVTLTGGEVFLREDFREIYEGLMNLGFIITIYTNGTLITHEVVQWLSKLPPSKVSITLYGSSRDTYELVTGQADAYDRTVRAIDLLKGAGITTQIKTTVVNGNQYDYDDILDFAYQRDIMLGIVNYISPRREGCNSDPIGNRLSPAELVEYEKHVTNVSKKFNIQKQNDIGAEDVMHEELQKKKELMIPKKLDPNDAFDCNAGKSGAWITWDGRLLPCGLLSKPQADPLKDGFKKAWKEIQYRCSLIPVCKECQECENINSCERCPARLLNETGHYDRPAPYLCETARIRNQEWTEQMASVV